MCDSVRTLHRMACVEFFFFPFFHIFSYGTEKIPHFICSHPFQSIFVCSQWLNAVNETANAIILNSSKNRHEPEKEWKNEKQPQCSNRQRTVTLNHFRVHIVQSFCGRSDNRRRDDNIDKRIQFDYFLFAENSKVRERRQRLPHSAINSSAIIHIISMRWHLHCKHFQHIYTLRIHFAGN